jgi:hypothetical protein
MTIVRLADKGGAPLTPAEADGNIGDLVARTAQAWTSFNVTPEVQPNDVDAPQLTLFRGGIYQYAYFQGQMSSAYASFAVPMDYAPGTDLKAAVQWTPGDFTHDGNVRFGMEFSYAWAYGSMSAPQNHAFTEPATVYTLASGHQNMTYHQHTKFFEATIPGSEVQPNMRFLIRFFRDGANPLDTFAGDIFVTGLGFYYQRNKLGQPDVLPPFV